MIWPVTPRTLPSVLPQYSPCRTEFDESIVDLVDAALTREEVDVSHFDSFRNLDHFQDTLRSVLPQMLRHFSASGAVDQLVRLAFDGCEHMDIVDFKGLSAGTVSEALETKELSGVKEISFLLMLFILLVLVTAQLFILQMLSHNAQILRRSTSCTNQKLCETTNLLDDDRVSNF